MPHTRVRSKHKPGLRVRNGRVALPRDRRYSIVTDTPPTFLIVAEP